jgi:hypothetical protein
MSMFFNMNGTISTIHHKNKVIKVNSPANVKIVNASFAAQPFNSGLLNGQLIESSSS